MPKIELIQGDCLEKMKDIPDGSIDMVLTDCPYKIVAGGATNKKGKHGVLTQSKAITSGKMFKHNDIKFIDWLTELYRVLKEQTHCLIMINGRNLKQLQVDAESAGFKFQNLLVWKKNNVTPNRYYMQSCEFVLFLKKGGSKTINDGGSSNFLEYPNIIGNKKHPSEKPVSLMEHLIANSTNEEELVLDPFMGSGTTGVACKSLNRNFIGIELDEDYFKIAEKRINENL